MMESFLHLKFAGGNQECLWLVVKIIFSFVGILLHNKNICKCVRASFNQAWTTKVKSFMRRF